MKLGSMQVETTASRREQLSMLIWGKPACGKTILAATAPGKKLFLQFDPGGTASLARSDDILVADYSGMAPAQIATLKQGTIVESDLTKLIREQNVSTVVVDSLTSLGQIALTYAIQSGKANGRNFVASLEMPGLTGYGIRSAILLDICAMVLRVCSDTKAHCIFVAHDKETLDDNGRIAEISVALGGQGQTAVPAKINEIWHMEDTGRERLIYVRSHGVKRPMRTRMFELGPKDTHFTWKYNQVDKTGDTLAKYYEAWEANSFERIAFPT